MAVFQAGAIPSTFGNVLYDPVRVDQAVQTQQHNALLMQGERQSMDFAAQKNPLEILQMRQSLGLESSPGLAALQKIYGGGAAPSAPASFEQRLGASEGGNNPAAVNKSGYSGQFQFGAARLADLGVYHPADGEDLGKNEWKGSFSIPGFAVATHDDFLKNAAAQHVVFGEHVADIDQAIANTPGADKLNADGLRAVAHLGGVSGMKRFISTGGLYDPADGNGTHLSQYYTKFAAGGPQALQQAFGSPHGPAGPGAAPGGGVAARISGAVDVAGPGAGPAPGYGPDGQPLAAGAWNASPAAAGAPAGAPTPSPGAPAGAPPPGAPAPAAAARAPATGMNSPQVQQAQQYLRQATQIEMTAAQYPNDPRVKAQAAAMVQDLRGRAQVLMTAGKVSVDPVTGIQTDQITGHQDPAAAPLAHYVWNGQAYVDTSGTHAPVTPPSPRLMMDKAGNAIQSNPGGGATVVAPVNTAGVANLHAAESQGTTAGAAAGKSVTEMANLSRTSAQAVGNIDYGVSQLDKARDGGINTGYFSGALTGVQSALKSLGLPTDKIPFINVSPEAIGNIQTARKTLAVVSGAILQQIIGKDSSITDAKIEAFIHAQPDITSDPQAVRRVLNWARSQFVYENEMSKAGMQAASQTGMVPLNFLPKYISEHGGGPVYDPLSGEMKQPDGQSPSREPPAAPAATAAPGGAPKAGAVEAGYRFKGGDPANKANWERVP